MERDAEVDAHLPARSRRRWRTPSPGRRRSRPTCGRSSPPCTSSADLERMGDLAEHVAKTALRRHPSPAVPAELRPVFQQMAEVADRMADKITIVLAKPDAELAAELEKDDDAMDDLRARSVQGAARRRLAVRRGDRDRRRAAGPLLRAVRRPRGERRRADDLPDHRRAGQPTADAERRAPRGRPALDGQRPWFATAAAASLAASGSRYAPPAVIGRRLASRS